MGGWQRIGVVISVLWLLGLPSYMLMSHNLRVQERYVDCLVTLRTGDAESVVGVSKEDWCRLWNVSASPLDAFGMPVGRDWAVGIGRFYGHRSSFFGLLAGSFSA
jgi:hypothetical protein